MKPVGLMLFLSISNLKVADVFTKNNTKCILGLFACILGRNRRITDEMKYYFDRNKNNLFV